MRRRHAALQSALAVSALCHLMVILGVVWWEPPPEPKRIAVRHGPRPQPQVDRFRASQSAVPSRSAWTRRQAADLVVPDVALDELAAPVVDADSLLQDLRRAPDGSGREQGWQIEEAAMPDVGDLAPQARPMPVAGPQMLQDIAEKRSLALVDTASGKLLKAWLYLPATGRCPGQPVTAAKRLDDLLTWMKRGQSTPRDLPLEHSIEPLPCGRVLRAEDLPRYRVILTDYIGVESPQALARHLVAGGFAMTSLDMMEQMTRWLEQQGRRRIQRFPIEPVHPLFEAFFDIDAYTFEGMTGVPRPFTGLMIDGRIAAIGGLSYRRDVTPSTTAGGAYATPAIRPRLANLLYVNALAFGLVQPSPLGGRYIPAASE